MYRIQYLRYLPRESQRSNIEENPIPIRPLGLTHNTTLDAGHAASNTYLPS